MFLLCLLFQNNRKTAKNKDFNRVEQNMREQEIEAYMRKELTGAGCLFLKWVSPGNAGVPDRIAILPGGEVVFLELKTDDGRPTPVQQWWQREIRKRGCIVRVVRGMEEAESMVRVLRSMIPRAPEDATALADPWRDEK